MSFYFSTNQKWGQAPFLFERGYSQYEDMTSENGACPHYSIFQDPLKKK